MQMVDENKQEEFNEVTLEILTLIANFKKRTSNAMVVGERNIIRGITIFENVIRELNVSEMNDDIMAMITCCINVALFKFEERHERINNHVHYGINQCLVILDGYNKRKNGPVKKLQNS